MSSQAYSWPVVNDSAQITTRSSMCCAIWVIRHDYRHTADLEPMTTVRLVNTQSSGTEVHRPMRSVRTRSECSDLTATSYRAPRLDTCRRSSLITK